MADITVPVPEDPLISVPVPQIQTISATIPLSGVPGPEGRRVQLGVTDTQVQWRYQGDETWTDLISIAEITGPQGDTGEQGPTGPQGPQGPTGPAGSDATVTSTSIGTALGYTPANAATLSSHLSDTANPHAVTKSQVGLGNVDNTSDAAKPISTATQAALDAKEPLQTPMTQAEAEAGTGTGIRSVTPQRIGQAITTLAVNFLRGAANTWAGIQTFTSSFVANGTNNTMPNQTAASGSSVMTRDLGDARWVKETIVYKSVSASITNTSTIAQETDLTISGVDVGTYLVNGLVGWESSGTGSGIKMGLYFTGTMPTWSPNGGGPSWEVTMRYNSGTNHPYPDQYGTLALGQPSTYAPAAGNTARDGYAVFQGVFKVTASGSLYLNWAQNTASTVTTYLVPGSYLQLRKIA